MIQTLLGAALLLGLIACFGIIQWIRGYRAAESRWKKLEGAVWNFLGPDRGNELYSRRKLRSAFNENVGLR